VKEQQTETPRAEAGLGRGGAAVQPAALVPLACRVVLLAVLCSGVVVVVLSPIDPALWLTADGLRAALGVGRWYAPVGYVATLVASIFLPVPKIVVLGLAGVLFGPWQGFVYAWIGQTLGMTALFLLARGGLRGVVRRVLHDRVPQLRRVDEQIARHGIRVVAALRLFYVMGTPVTVVLSTTRIRLAQYVAGTAVGVVPAVALAVVSGDAVATGVTGLKAAVVGLAVVLVIGVGTVVRRRFGV